MKLLQIALRNLFRQRRRTALTGLAIAIGVCAVVFVIGFFNGVITMMMKLTVESSIGALQIHKKGYADADEPLKFDMPEDAAMLARIKAVKGVTAVAPRLMFEGLMNNGTGASVVIGTGISPVDELLVCPGRAEQFGPTPFTSRQGEDVIVGDELANALGLHVGSTATFLAPTQRGTSNALDTTIKGLLEVKLPLASKVVGIVPLDFAQSLVRMPGRVTEYAVSVTDLDLAPAIAKDLATALGVEYEVQTWREREPAAGAAIDRFAIIVTIASFALFLLIGAILMNSMLMSLQERVREIGTMMSLGVRRRQVLSIILTEASLLAFLAAAIGAVIGALIVFWLHHRGIMFVLRGAKPLQVFPYAGFALIAKAIVGAVIGAVVAALYPAFKASRLSPVEALRTL
jgi:putative ABC transport system permease protein